MRLSQAYRWVNTNNTVGFVALTVGIVISLAVATPSFGARGSSYKSIYLNDEYDHERFVNLPASDTPGSDHIRRFRAYTSLFDGIDDDDGDGDSDVLRVPHFVTYELKARQTKRHKYQRPSVWITDRSLARKRIAPWDNSYRYTSVFRNQHPNWYERGHLCTKFHANQLGPNADWNTHTLLNAVPQRADFNRGIWYDLEKKIAEWANEFGPVWVIAGPIFENGDLDEIGYIGEAQDNELPVAIPHSLFKIIIRENQGRIEAMAFIYPQDVSKHPKGSPYDHTAFLTSIDDIEHHTGFDFVIPDAKRDNMEAKISRTLWPSPQRKRRTK